MKIVALRTHSLSCDPIISPIRRLGHDLREITFFTPNVPFDHGQLPGQIDQIGADFVVMLGQNDDGGGHVPPAYILDQVSQKRPFLHICCDGSETVWWPQLQHYKELAPRMMHVNIDGVARGFFEDNGVTTLCPMDHEPWGRHMLSWPERPHAVVFCGGWGVKHPRGDRVEEVLKLGLMHAIKRPFPDYEGFRAFMGAARCSWNHAATGTADHMHVKARVLEAAFAGAVLMEPEGSPTGNYFTAGEDYLLYKTNDDIAAHKRMIERPDSGLWRMADRMREKAIDLYSAERFWPKMFRMAGLQ